MKNINLREKCKRCGKINAKHYFAPKNDQFSQTFSIMRKKEIQKALQVSKSQKKLCSFNFIPNYHFFFKIYFLKNFYRNNENLEYKTKFPLNSRLGLILKMSLNFIKISASCPYKLCPNLIKRI